MSNIMKKRISALLLIVAICIASYLIIEETFPRWFHISDVPESDELDRPTPTLPTEPEDPIIPDEVDGLPVGKLVITPERTQYIGGTLTLRIPAIEVVATVNNGTEPDDLRSGVGLYEYAQLPGEGNRNVSIAGHRNGLSQGKVTDKAPFYYIDRLKEGDYIYLVDKTNIYRYVWQSTEIVEADDWNPIYTTGTSCITITSCHPIGISDHRIIVRGELDDIFTGDEVHNYNF